MFLIMQQRYNEQSDYQKPTSTSEAKVERDHSKDVLKIHSS
jgi:RecB family endonuclease NucS